MNKVGEMTNSEVRHILDDPKDKVMLMSHVIPKLQKFGIIRTDAENGSRRYNIRFDRAFTMNFINMSMNWLVYYSKHHNEKLKLEGNPIE